MRILLSGLLLFGSGALTNAAIIFQSGNNPQPSEQNVMFTSGATGTSITGTTNQSNQQVLFTSSQTLLASANGQAVANNASGSPLTNVTISMPGFSFGDLIVNPAINAAGTCSGCGGSLTISALAASGTTYNSSAFSLTNGNNFITVVATGSDSIQSATLTATGGGFQSLQQPRISGPFTPLSTGPTGPTGPTGQIPEPGTYLLMSSGLLAFGLLRKRMFSK